MASSSSGHGYLGSELPPSSTDSQRPAADQLEVRHDLSSETVFRLHILGRRNWDKSQIDEARVEQLVRKAFDVTPDAKIVIKSLADHPLTQALVATLNFSRIPTRVSQTTPSLQEFDETVEGLSLDLDTHFNGFTPLHSNTGSEHTSDLIALSGLGGHAFGSFKRRDGDFMWLRDDLPVSIPDARVFVYGYDTGLEYSTSFQSLEDLGLSFKDALRSLLKENWKSGFLKPLVLLGHSLGGLILKEALCQMSANPKGDEEYLLKSIRAVLFFGTPNQGMDITSLIPMVEGQANEEFLRSLGTDSADLRRQAQQWSKVFDFAKPTFISNNLEITSFYETSTSRTAVQIDGKWKMSGPPARFVNRFSATHGRAWEQDERFVQPIDRDHSGLVKFRGRNDPVYVNHVLPRLQSYLPNDRYKRPQSCLTTEEKDCLSSLDFPERTSRQDQIMGARENTCEWLLENQTYRSWLHGSEGLLWLKGHPGTGKSTLTKYAVEARKAHASSGHVVFAHFFHGRGSDIQMSALGLVRSLACQLLENFSSSWTEVMKKFEEMGSTSSWKLEWLCSFLEGQFRQVCKSQPIIIFVDALDECEDKDRHFLGEFFADNVRGSLGSGLKIFVSCRHYPNLFSEGLKIDAEINNANDIAVFVKSKLQTIPKEKRLLIADEIIDKARGNFQWAKIVTVESVKFHRRGRTVVQIQQTIRQLPKDISELYDRLFQDADSEDLQLAYPLFHWLCFAKRLLSIHEVQYIIMLSPDIKESSFKDIRRRPDFRKELNDMVNTIIDVSRGLAEVLVSDNLARKTCWSSLTRIDNTSTQVDEAHLIPTWASKVQLIHQTVMDYLQNTGLQRIEKGRQERYKFSRDKSNYFISRSCLRCAMMDKFVDQTHHPSRFQNEVLKARNRNPLHAYMSAFLNSHLLEVDSGGIHHSDFIARLGWPHNQSNLVNLAIALEERPFMETYLGWDPPAEQLFGSEPDYHGLLHWAAEKGLDGIVKSIVRYKFSQSQEGSSHGTVNVTLELDIRTWGGQNVFINGYFNVNLRNERGSALDRAIANGQALVVRELLRSPVIDPNAQDFNGRTPLHNAIARGQRQIVTNLLEHPRIDTTLQDHNGTTANFYAVKQSDLEILRMNVDVAKTSVNIRDSFRYTPLLRAILNGSADVVKLFVDCGNCTTESLQVAYDMAHLFGQYEMGGIEVQWKKCAELLVRTGLVTKARNMPDSIHTRRNPMGSWQRATEEMDVDLMHIGSWTYSSSRKA